jgi:hypothetical protein
MTFGRDYTYPTDRINGYDLDGLKCTSSTGHEYECEANRTGPRLGPGQLLAFNGDPDFGKLVAGKWVRQDDWNLEVSFSV